MAPLIRTLTSAATYLTDNMNVPTRKTAHMYIYRPHAGTGRVQVPYPYTPPPLSRTAAPLMLWRWWGLPTRAATVATRSRIRHSPRLGVHTPRLQGSRHVPGKIKALVPPCVPMDPPSWAPNFGHPVAKVRAPKTERLPIRHDSSCQMGCSGSPGLPIRSPCIGTMERPRAAHGRPMCIHDSEPMASASN